MSIHQTVSVIKKSHIYEIVETGPSLNYLDKEGEGYLTPRLRSTPIIPKLNLGRETDIPRQVRPADLKVI